MNNPKNRGKILAALSFLVAVSSSFSSELRGLITPGPGKEIQARLTRHTVYVRKDATNASSRWTIIDENTSKVDGVSSISKTSLPKNEAVVFDKVAIGFSEAAAGKVGAVDYNSVAPAALRNAILVISQNGREVLELPVAEMTKPGSPNSQSNYYHDLEGFHYLVDDMPMEWLLKFPDGQSLTPVTAGNATYLEVRLQGYKTSRKQ